METTIALAGRVERLVMFFRKVTQCKFGIHWNMKYDSGMANDICRAGTCLDCGHRTEGITWPKPPPVKSSRSPSVCPDCGSDNIEHGRTARKGQRIAHCGSCHGWFGPRQG